MKERRIIAEGRITQAPSEENGWDMRIDPYPAGDREELTEMLVSGAALLDVDLKTMTYRLYAKG